MDAKSRDKLTTDRRQFQERLAAIDQQGEALIHAHKNLIADRQAVAGALQYIDGLLGTPKKS